MSFRLAWSVALLAPLTVSLASSAQAQFETRAAFAVGEVIPYSLVVGDFNGDGIVDVAVVNVVQNTTGNVEILLGNGDGTFRMGATYPLTDPGGWPSFSAFPFPIRNSGCPVLALFARAGGDAACTSDLRCDWLSDQKEASLAIRASSSQAMFVFVVSLMSSARRRGTHRSHFDNSF